MMYRISGHESFPCRYAWLPKAVRGLRDNPMLFANDSEDQAMVELGLGKNMVRSARFWSLVTGVATAAPEKGTGYQLTDFGVTLLGERGLDPFLEDIRTLWLLHWNLSTNVENPLLAWDFLLNRWHDPELVPRTVVEVLKKEASKDDDKVSHASVEQHFETFLHTYYPTRSRKGDVQEDNLDSPLVELDLIIKVGEREIERSSGKREAIYSFRREEKPEISPELFAYCVADFWQKSHAQNETIPFREVAHGHGSPGQIFKLPEDDIRSRLETIERQTGGLFTYIESANMQQLQKRGDLNSIEMLKEIYQEETLHA
ncbi:DUF4007 family protein [Verrucomicrobiota bacterium sgz303538]